MPNSLRYYQLVNELKRLRRNFLPKSWSPTGDYSDQKRDRARAYRIMAHAEIEFFIEKILEDLVQNKYDMWKNKRKFCYVLSCLMVAAKLGWQDEEGEHTGLEPIKILHKTENINSIDEYLGRIVNTYLKSIIMHNNGITQADLKKLLYPVGISLDDLDGTWLNNMNSFGNSRGESAHNSRTGLTNLYDPESEFKKVEDLLVGLQQLDEIVREIYKK